MFWLKRSLGILFALLLTASLLLGACKPAAEAPVVEEPAVDAPADDETAPDPVTLVIGFTASITGKYETSSGRQVAGIQLWMDQFHEAGGITLSDGPVVTFESVSYDD